MDVWAENAAFTTDTHSSSSTWLCVYRSRSIAKRVGEILSSWVFMTWVQGWKRLLQKKGWTPHLLPLTCLVLRPNSAAVCEWMIPNCNETSYGCRNQPMGLGFLLQHRPGREELAHAAACLHHWGITSLLVLVIKPGWANSHHEVKKSTQVPLTELPRNLY